MAKFSNLSAPITNPQATKRIADTQALKARQATQTPATIQQSGQIGAQLTAQAGQANLAQQATQAGLAKAQTANVMQNQQQAAQKDLFNQQQQQTTEERLLNDSIFNINQDAATQEQNMRTAFTNGQAQTEYLQEQELADWALLNSQNEEDFKDKIQVMEQAHSKETAMVNHAYKTIMQDLQQQANQASIEDKRVLTEELQQIQQQWDEEMRKRQNAANNKRSMYGAVGSVVGGIGGGIAGFFAGGPAGSAVGASVGAGVGENVGTYAAST